MLFRAIDVVLAHLRFGRAVVLLAALSGLSPLAMAASGVPDWVKAAAAQSLPFYPPTTKAVVLLNETTYTVAPDGRATTHVRYAVKVLRPQGREYAIPHVAFDRETKVNYMHVWCVGPDGHEYAPKDNELIEIGLPGEGGQLYTDDKFKVMLSPPGSDPGGVVAWEYERRERPYVAETTWSFQSDLPHLKESFILNLPEGFSQSTTWAHHKPDAGIDLEHHHWRWDMENVPAVDLERVTMSPSPYAIAGRMTVHYAGPTLAMPQDGTWQGIGEWYDVLAHDRLQPSPEISAKAAELTQGKTDFYDKVEAIGEFAQQQIRYFVVELGIGGYRPHAAGEIFHNGYGDCKDKATLLSAMLSTVGVHSALLMVHTDRGVIDPEAPSTVGNHMIAAIEIPAGYKSAKLRSVVTAKTGKRYLIFDPTWEKTAFGQLEQNLQGSYGVLLEGKDSQVIQLPVLDPELNTIRRTASFQLAADGELKGTVKELRFGDVSEREREVFTREDSKIRQKFFDLQMNRDFTAVSVTDLKVENAAALNKDLATTYALDASRFATATGPLLMVRPRVLGSYGLPVDHERRRVPVDLGSTMRGHDEFDIALPAGYVVDELPDPVKVDFGFATYESSTVLKDQTLHYSRTFTMRQVTLPAEKYGELQRLASVIEADEQSRAVLKRSK